MNKYIIDTDIGDDIDDAFAIAYAIKAGLPVVGITTVFRNTIRRAKMAKMLLKTLGCPDITVCAGIDFPVNAPIIALENDYYAPDGSFIPCQYISQMDSEHYDEQHAVDYIIDTVRANPGDVTLILIGPQTNIAAALEKAPDILEDIKEIVMMGGKYYESDMAEWNILCDPEAAATVFESGVPIRAVGLDVTMQCKLEGEAMKTFQENSAGICTLISQLMESWFQHYKFASPVLHDPLTIGVLLKDYVAFEQQKVKVVTDKTHYGTTLLQGTAQAQIGKNVESAEFMSDFIHVICGEQA